MNVLDLFSGIGGFSLGLERAGMRTVAFCEIDPYCRAVLRKHWPAVPCFEDVRNLHAFDVGPVDVICGGFPCQDISVAGHGAGLAGERSGLWSEYRRLIEEIRPAWAIVENVGALRSRGLDQVLRELAALGYDAEWHCIPASAVGAPHRRDRVWIIAYPECQQLRDEPGRCGRQDRQGARLASDDGQEGAMAYAAGNGRGARRPGGSAGLDTRLCDTARPLAYANGEPPIGSSIAWPECTAWDVEPDVGRVVDGVPYRLVEDDLRALGNAVVPQIPELIGRAILEFESVR